MGTSARDNIDIGVGVHEIAGSAQIVDRLKGKIAELRAEAAKPVKTALADAFRQELEALRENLGLEQSLIDEALAKRQTTETAAQRARLAAIERFAQEEIALRQRFGGVIPSATPTVGTTQLGPTQAVAATLVTAQQGAEQLSTKINVAIGAYQRMARTIDITDTVAVAAFRAEGDALASYLLKLGATDAELNQIGATIAKVERRAGAAQIVPPIGAATLNSYNQVNPKLRTAANAASLLGVAAVSGSGSLQGMALAAGNVAQGVAVLTTNVRIATAATGIGALVTVAATVIGLFIRWREEQDKTAKSIQNLGALGAGGLEVQLKAVDSIVAALEKGKKDLQAKDFSAFGPLQGELSLQNDRAIALIDKRLKAERARANEIRGLLPAAAQKAAADVAEIERKANEESAQIRLARIQGETAASRLRVENEFQAQRRIIDRSGASEAERSSAIARERQKADQQLLTIDKDHADKVAELRQKAAGALAVIQADQLNGEVAAQRETVRVELDDKIAQINREVGLESVRAIRIADARADAANKIRKIDREQTEKALAAEAELRRNIAAASVVGPDVVAQATETANQRRRERQREIDKISLADAQATAAEKRTQEVLADQERDTAIEQARREHGEQLKRITDESENAILELTGKASQARINIINAEIDERIKAAKKIGASTEGLERERTVRINLVGIEDLQSKGAKALDDLDAKLKETEQLAVSGAISEREARERVIEAYSRARDQLADIVPLLLRVAQASGNEDAIKNAEALNLKYLELTNTLSHVRDGFGRLKATAREAAQSALENLFVGVTKLGTQDKTEINALSEQLRGAREELNALFADATRTPEENKRITELRNEIEQTEVGLERAKTALTSWRDLFLQAAQSVIDALIKVSAQMLATAIIERTLGFFSGIGGGGGLGSNLSSGGATGVVNAASGGLILGPGSTTSDSIDARLSNREFVQPAVATDYYGADWMEAQRRRLIPRDAARRLLDDIRIGARMHIVEPRRATRFFAEGGLVSAAGAMRQSSAGETHHVRIVAPPGFRLEQINSPEGAQVLVELVSERANAFNAALGRSV